MIFNKDVRNSMPDVDMNEVRALSKAFTKGPSSLWKPVFKVLFRPSISLCYVYIIGIVLLVIRMLNFLSVATSLGSL